MYAREGESLGTRLIIMHILLCVCTQYIHTVQVHVRLCCVVCLLSECS